MAVLPKKSSPALRRRLPFPSFGIDINFCRNPQCDLFAEPPDPYDKRGKSSGKRQIEPTSWKGDRFWRRENLQVAGACGQSSIIKNNGAIVEEYRRLRGRFQPEAPRDVCPSASCANHTKPLSQHPDRYRKSGRTAKGAQRWKCKSCLTSFSLGSRIRRQHRSNSNREVLWMITNGVPISKISDFTGLCPRDVYRKIDFIYDRVVDLTARREGSFESGSIGTGWVGGSQPTRRRST